LPGASNHRLCVRSTAEGQIAECDWPRPVVARAEHIQNLLFKVRRGHYDTSLSVRDNQTAVALPTIFLLSRKAGATSAANYHSGSRSLTATAMTRTTCAQAQITAPISRRLVGSVRISAMRNLRKTMRRRRLLLDIDRVGAADATTAQHHLHRGLAETKRYPIMSSDGMRAAIAVDSRLCVLEGLDVDVDVRLRTGHRDTPATRQ
jgi:hypothetical protein